MALESEPNKIGSRVRLESESKYISVPYSAKQINFNPLPKSHYYESHDNKIGMRDGVLRFTNSAKFGWDCTAVAPPRGGEIYGSHAFQNYFLFVFFLIPSHANIARTHEPKFMHNSTKDVRRRVNIVYLLWQLEAIFSQSCDFLGSFSPKVHTFHRLLGNSTQMKTLNASKTAEDRQIMSMEDEYKLGATLL